MNGFWSPLAARHGLRALALAPAGDCAEMFGELGGMSLSATALNHLMEMVGAAWEVLEEETLESMRLAEVIPAEAAAPSISLNGVMLGMRNEKDEAPQEEPTRAAATGFREASSGTVSDHGGVVSQSLSPVAGPFVPDYFGHGLEWARNNPARDWWTFSPAG